MFFFFKQKTAYEMRISDWSSDVCSSDLVDNPSQYFTEYCRRYSDMPLLVRLEKRADGRLVPERLLRASDLGGLGEANNPEWKTLAYDEARSEERRVGKGCVSPCRFWLSPKH